jgi:hypothetical protein
MQPSRLCPLPAVSTANAARFAVQQLCNMHVLHTCDKKSWQVSANILWCPGYVSSLPPESANSNSVTVRQSQRRCYDPPIIPS